MEKLKTFSEPKSKNKHNSSDEFLDKHKSIKRVREFENRVRAKKTIKIVCINDLNQNKKLKENN